MKNEFYDSTLRKKIYTSLEELQTDADAWLRYYNCERRIRENTAWASLMQPFNENCLLISTIN
jgi:hypothetical protein